MSDTPEGAGWWQAADGKWYPPEHHPEFRPARVPPWRRPPVRTAAIVGALIGLVVGVLTGLAGRDDGSEAVTATEDPQATPTEIASPDTAPATPEPADETPTTAPTATPEPTVAAQPTPTPEPTARPVPPPVNGIVLSPTGIGVASFGEPAGATIGLVEAELGSPTLDTRWITLENATPDGDGFADDPTSPTITFAFPEYRQVCWGDVVMLCTIHGRFDAESATFVGWEQAHRAARAYGSEAIEDPAMGATAEGAAVGRAAALLASGATFDRTVDGLVVASGAFDAWVAGTWPADATDADLEQPVLCLAGGVRTTVASVEPCVVSVLDTNPINRVARTVLRRAITGLDPVFLAERVPDGPTPGAGYAAFDNSGVRNELETLSSLDDDATIEAAPDVVVDADPTFGGTSCALPGDISVVCGYRIVSSETTVIVEIVFQNTGVVSVTIAPG